MDERIKESISALMDDEINELELQRILSQADRNEVAGQWQRYHAVRDVMQGETYSEQDGGIGAGDLPFIDISQSVSEWIENEEPGDDVVTESAQAENKPVSNYPRTGGLLAVAASVAFAVLFLFQNSAVDSPVGNPSAIAQIGAENNLQTVSAQKQPVMIDHIDEDHARRLNQYLLRHAEHSMHGGRHGTMPFVRVASVNSVGI